MKKEALRLERVTLLNEETPLLDQCSFHLFEGEILGLVGIDAYGREALMQLLCKNTPIDFGYIYLNEKLVNSYRHSDDSENRVSIIQEESKLINSLSVADNVFVLRPGFKAHWIHSRMLEKQFQLLIEDLPIRLDGKRYASGLTNFERCMVEFLRAIVMRAQVIVLRDISNFISAEELEQFKNVVQYFAQQGFSIIYICNHHQDAFSICKRICLMENGRIIKVLDHDSFAEETIDAFTLDFRRLPSSTSPSAEKGICEFKEVLTNQLQRISFSIESGECLVLLDLSNTALNDIFALLNGAMTPEAGKINWHGVNFFKQRKNNIEKIAYISDQPTQSMLFPEMTPLENLCFSLDKRVLWLWSRARMRKHIGKEYESKIGPELWKRDLSDCSLHSLYSLVYYRVHLYNPDLVVIVQPFAHADMYTRHHILSMMRDLQKKGIAILILAVNIADCLTIADRLLLLKDGSIRLELQSEEFDQLQPQL